ncbi:MAG TPA: translation initiation factor [Phycisphaerales bacterium]|nr:translation initiation factor [Phycisphaerales bacterium]
MGLFDGTKLERPVTCERCGLALAQCRCPRNAQGAVMPPSEQSPRVRREKRNGKFVTVVTGLDPVANDLGAMLKAWRSGMGTGGTLDKSSNTIELQGDHRDRIVAELVAKGFKAKPAGG